MTTETTTEIPATETKKPTHGKKTGAKKGAANAKKAKAPLSEVHRRLLERLEAAGYGDADNSAIIMAYE